jgi:hypothetical protein
MQHVNGIEQAKCGGGRAIGNPNDLPPPALLGQRRLLH